ncbi:gamma-glutamylcyclotransferase [Photobacterium sp. GJ3]|uniref:gamma-glutamylcyclotransferase family protein n=1 Tax=Photobacterium sp. GJ3 TaxID=2829502 RepID=UPI001B8D1C14|nr:gamma-glutamylcyclotransferase family protein [Photobacterium sp. GJ3]QUJ68465.1 gamma-glutamylcyclotransferase [Photobacterium sp. GJ3]
MYIFGYGSLINRASRQRTGQTGAAIPAEVEGLQRHWGKVDGSYAISPLVASLGEGRCNGVLLKVEDHFLGHFDQRERGYQRVELDPARILQDELLSFDAPIWVYVKENPAPPCDQQPIMQTYVDTVLAGCLSISDAFARTFVETTSGWHHPLENDRESPKYGNLAGVEEAHLPCIDRLVHRSRKPF